MIIKSDDKKYPKEAELLEIVIFPDAVLKKKVSPITTFDAKLKKLAANMIKTMYHAPGIGLAAPQINVSQSIFVLDVDYDRKKINDDENEPIYELTNLNPIVFINPKLSELEGETTYEEGCLSLPGIFDEVERFKTLKVDYQDVDGKAHSMKADDLLSICIQHEFDHLEGILFIEKLSKLKYNFYKKKLIKEKNSH
jgi:peptide deformylase